MGEVFEEGNEYMKIGWYNKAIESFKKSLKDCPNDKKWEINKKLGDCCRYIKLYNIAIKFYEESLKNCPDNKKYKICKRLEKCYNNGKMKVEIKIEIEELKKEIENLKKIEEKFISIIL